MLDVSWFYDNSNTAKKGVCTNIIYTTNVLNSTETTK